MSQPDYDIDSVCPYCLSNVNEKALVCDKCGRDLYLVKKLQDRICELEKILGDNMPENKTGQRIETKNPKSFIWLSVIYAISNIVLTLVLYTPEFGDLGTKAHIISVLILSIIYGVFGIIVKGPRNAFIVGLIVVLNIFLLTPIVKAVAAFQDATEYSNKLERNTVLAVIAAAVGCLFATIFNRKVTLRQVFNVQKFFKRLEGSQTLVEKSESLFLKSATALTFLLWIIHRIFPNLS